MFWDFIGKYDNAEHVETWPGKENFDPVWSSGAERYLKKSSKRLYINALTITFFVVHLIKYILLYKQDHGICEWHLKEARILCWFLIFFFFTLPALLSVLLQVFAASAFTIWRENMVQIQDGWWIFLLYQIWYCYKKQGLFSQSDFHTFIWLIGC